MTINIINGNSLDLIKKIESESINLIITSPPYFQQRTYGNKDEIGQEKEIDLYLNKLIDLFKECIRVIKQDGSIIWNLGDKYLNGNLQLIPYKFAIEASNYLTLINNITWEKTNACPKQFKKRLTSSTEPFFHFIKSKNYKYYLDRLNEKTQKKSGDNVGQQYFKLIKNSKLSENEKNNAIEELNKAIKDVKEGNLVGFRMKIRDVHSLAFGGQRGGRNDQIIKNGFTIIKLYGNSIKKDIFSNSVETIRGIEHPAIYPLELIKKFILLTTDENDIILDPFLGSGTTALACKELNRNCVGFELYEKYIKIAWDRINHLP